MTKLKKNLLLSLLLIPGYGLIFLSDAYHMEYFLMALPFLMIGGYFAGAALFYCHPNSK